MKQPIAKSLHDLHECYNKRVVSTIAYNLPYAIQRRKKQVLELDKKYPKGTFFVITNNGERPKI